MGPMSKGAVDSVLGAVSLGVCLMDADSSFVVTQVIPPLCVSSSSMQEGTLISLGADSRGLVVLGAVDVGAVVEGAVAAADGPAPALVHKVPVEAGVGPVLSALVLHEERALLRAELLQVPAGSGL